VASKRSSSNFHYNLFFFFSCEDSEAKIKTHLSRNLDEPREQISDLCSLYFRIYDLRKLGFFQAPEFHVKHVTLGKAS